MVKISCEAQEPTCRRSKAQIFFMDVILEVSHVKKEGGVYFQMHSSVDVKSETTFNLFSGNPLQLLTV